MELQVRIFLKNLKTVKSIPKNILDPEVPDLVEIRGEIYIGKEDFKKIKKILPILEMPLEAH